MILRENKRTTRKRNMAVPLIEESNRQDGSCNLREVQDFGQAERTGCGGNGDIANTDYGKALFGCNPQADVSWGHGDKEGPVGHYMIGRPRID
jgi:hypothetical protein